MKPEMEGKIKFVVWGLICGIVVGTAIGYTWGGWTTFGTTSKTVEVKPAPMNSPYDSVETVLASQAAICIAQFVKDPNYEAKLKEYDATDSWNRAGFIKKGGWDKMPGQNAADSKVSSACAAGIEVLIKK